MQKDIADANHDKATADAWDEGGTNRVMAHIIGGGLIVGLGGGSIGTAAAGAAGAGMASAFGGKLNGLADNIGDATGSMLIGNVTSNILAGVGGAIVGGGAGAATASSVHLYNDSSKNANGTAGTGSEFADRVWNAVKNVVDDPGGALNYALNSIIPSPSDAPFGRRTQTDAQVVTGESGTPKKWSEQSATDLMAQGAANGGNAIAGSKGGEPPMANPGTVLADSTAGAAGKSPAIGTPGYVPSNATFNGGNGEQDSQRDASISSVSDFQNAADQPFNDSGLSAAARAWDKHAGRAGGTFESLTGSIADKNAAASEFVNQVLNDPATTRTELSRGGVEFRQPNGQGIRFNADGSFSGVLDPRK